MTNLIDKIMSEIESDPRIDAREISLDIRSKGLLRRKRTLNVIGMVESKDERDKVLEIARRQAGTDYEITDNLVVV